MKNRNWVRTASMAGKSWKPEKTLSVAGNNDGAVERTRRSSTSWSCANVLPATKPAPRKSSGGQFAGAARRAGEPLRLLRPAPASSAVLLRAGAEGLPTHSALTACSLSPELLFRRPATGELLARAPAHAAAARAPLSAPSGPRQPRPTLPSSAMLAQTEPAQPAVSAPRGACAAAVSAPWSRRCTRSARGGASGWPLRHQRPPELRGLAAQAAPHADMPCRPSHATAASAEAGTGVLHRQS